MRWTLAGLVPVLATPFDTHGALDRASLRRLVEFELDSGVDGVATFGMASEGFAITAAERTMILGTIRDVAGADLPVVAGVNATSTVTAVEQARHAVDGGADMLMVLPPYLVKPTSQQLVDFYGDVAAAAGVPVQVQDAPGSTGVAMPPPLIAQLSRLDGVESVKIEAPPTAIKVGAVRTVVDDAFAIFGGLNAQSALDELVRGAVGTMPACEFPDLLRPILDDMLEGRDEQSPRQAFAELLPLILLGLQPGVAWSIHKHVLVRRGIIDTATVRSPAQPADDVTVAAIPGVLDRVGSGRVRVHE
jgi:dihydrodipicolinate synthase/N-acetylneuraminate lyase